MTARLKSTKNIFNNRNTTIITLVTKVGKNINSDYHQLNRIRGSLLRSTQQKTIVKISQKLSVLAEGMALNPSSTVDKDKLLRKIERYKRQNSFLQYAAVQQAIISLCANYEDIIQMIIVKYFEEDVTRLTKNKQTLTSSFVLSAVIRGDNLHHTLAEEAAKSIMYGGVKDWHRYLKRMGMETDIVPHGVEEVFLIRHCLVHNNHRVSSKLHAKNPRKYPLRRALRLDINDVLKFKDDLHQSMLFIVKEYNRLFPEPGGTWIGRNVETDSNS